MLNLMLRLTMLGAILWSPSVGSAEENDPNYMMALNVYHEGRSEGREGMIAVGWVVLNRVAADNYPSDVVAVITQKKRGLKCEWRWWCDGKSDKPTEAERWAEAQAVAADLLSADPPADPTDGALWFHETFRERPSWMGDNVVRTATLGNHHFYGLR